MERVRSPIEKIKPHLSLRNASITLVGLGMLLAGPSVNDFLTVDSKEQKIAALATETIQNRVNTPVPRLTDVLQTPTPGVVISVETPIPLLPKETRPAATSTPIPAPRIVEALGRIQIPSIKLDSEVKAAPPEFDAQGYVSWPVPDFVVGQLQYKAGPDDSLPYTVGPEDRGGNIVLVGHIDSLTHGRVFYDLPDVEVGDQIVLLSKTNRPFSYRVRQVKITGREDSSILNPVSTENIATIVTCTGRFLSEVGDYEERFVVVAEQER